jgi:hypothetical protein
MFQFVKSNFKTIFRVLVRSPPDKATQYLCLFYLPATGPDFGLYIYEILDFQFHLHISDYKSITKNKLTISFVFK